MIEQFSFYLGMVVLIVLVIMLANRIKVAYPILLVLVGLGICFIPGTPKIRIDPELIFIFFLPPLLYEAAWNISWKEMWRWRRIISSFAFPVVFLTAFSVALVANYFIPGFSLALGFLLGGIVSPPDAVSASAILRFVKIPRHLSAILEGESLLNDASSLIIFRFAMIAAATGQFIWYDAVGDFFWMILAGTGIGLLIGFLFMNAHKVLPTDVNMDIILTLVAPYVMYIAAEEAQASGVLAVVSGGLFLSYYRHRFLTGSSRLRAENVWQSLVFLLNGLVFLLIGLDLPEIIDGLHEEGTSFAEASQYALLITAVLIVGRMLVAYLTVVFTSVAGRFIPVAEKSPGWKAPLVMGWTGMRGVVSLAAALSIPVTMSDGSDFPQRNLILFITFGVILLTLVIQGLTLPVLIRKTKLPPYKGYRPEEETENFIREGMAKRASEFLMKNYETQLAQSFHLRQLVERHKSDVEAKGETKLTKEVKKISLEVLDQQRRFLTEKNKADSNLDESLLRKYLHIIDIEEEKIRHM